MTALRFLRVWLMVACVFLVGNMVMIVVNIQAGSALTILAAAFGVLLAGRAMILTVRAIRVRTRPGNQKGTS